MTTPSNLRTNQENQVFCSLTRLPQEQRPISEDSNRNNVFGIGNLPGGSASSDQSPTINEESLGHLLIPTPIEAMDLNDLSMNEIMENDEDMKRFFRNLLKDADDY
jgi:hypothetical protein